VFCAGIDLNQATENYLGTGNFIDEDPYASPSLCRAWYFNNPLIAGCTVTSTLERP